MSSNSHLLPPFLSYRHVSLPNLSSSRNPISPFAQTATRLPQQCSDLQILVALARCAGSYCSVEDVLVGYRSGDRTRTARISWGATPTWSGLIERTNLQDLDEGEVRELLDIQDTPYLAVLSNSSHDNSFSHPLHALHENDHLVFKASASHFNESSLAIFASQIVSILTQLQSNPNASPADLSFIPRQLTSCVDPFSSRAKFEHLERAANVIELVSRQVKQLPNHVALEYHKDLATQAAPEVLTFEELEVFSNKIAHYLTSLGLKVEERVAICLPRGLEFHVWLFGILKAGCCYVPVDQDLPKERRDFIVQDSGAVLFIDEEYSSRHYDIALECESEPINLGSPENLAYLLYTSGTTGTPKGCLLTHEGLSEAIFSLAWFSNEAKREDSRYIGIASVAFDVHLSETFVPLVIGISLITAPRTQLLEDLPRYLHMLRISHVGLVPSLIEATMLAVESFSGDEGQEMALRYIASGGEKISDAILDRWTNNSQVMLANFYGPSEVTIGCAATFMDKDTRKENVGPVFESCSAYVVDEHLNPVLRGAAGELVVGGPLVGRGYHNRPDLTKKSFVTMEGVKAYRTGDLVRLMPDNSFEILGRIDTQIKLRGVRIESEGISAILRNAASTFSGDSATVSTQDVFTVLSRHPAIKSDQLVSFISLSNVPVAVRRSSKPSVRKEVPEGLLAALRDACTKQFASYMRPAHIIPVDFLPLNNNGKIDTKPLTALFCETPLEVLTSLANIYPKTNRTVPLVVEERDQETEEKLIQIVSSFLQAPKSVMNAEINLLEFGIDSIRAIKLNALIIRAFSLPVASLSYSDILRYPVIQDLASIVASRHRRTDYLSGRNRFDLEKWQQEREQEIKESDHSVTFERVLPTFPIQDGVLYLSSSYKSSYVQHVIFRLQPQVHTIKVKEGWIKLAAQLEILRTVFLFSNSIIQVVLQNSAIKVPWEEINCDSILPTDFRTWFLDEEASQIAESINANISTNPPYRLNLYRPNLSTFLVLSIHHSLFDGVSLPRLISYAEDLIADRNIPENIGALSPVLQRIYSYNHDRAISFWKKELNGFKRPSLSNQVQARSSSKTLTETLVLKLGLSEWSNRAARSKVTLQALLMSAFGIVLTRKVYHRSDVCYGVIRSGRSFENEGLNNAQCPLISVLPFRFNFNHDILHETQSSIARILEFEHIPLNKVQQWVCPGENLIEILFSVTEVVHLTSQLWDVVSSVQPETEYPLAVEASLDEGHDLITLSAAFSENFEQRTVRDILVDLETAMSSLIVGEEPHFISPPSFSDDEREQSTANGDFDSTEDIFEEVDEVDEEVIKKLRVLISRFLNVEPASVSPTATLITLGLDSVKSIALSRQLRSEGLNISAVDLMRQRNICRLASVLSKADYNYKQVTSEKLGQDLLNSRLEDIRRVTGDLNCKLSVSDNVSYCPTTTLQSGMLSQTISSRGHLYVHSFIFNVMHGIDPERLRLACLEVVRSTAILRTSFHFIADAGYWIQVVHSDEDFKWEEKRAASDDSGSISDLIERTVSHFDFGTEAIFQRPPIYFCLVLLPDQNYKIILILHHALYDGVSISRISNAVKAAYYEEAHCGSPQFNDFLGYFEYQNLHGTKFWLEYLRNYKRPFIKRKASESSNDQSVSIRIPITPGRVEEACRSFCVTSQCVGQAAMAIALAELYQTPDTVFGLVVSGRSVPRTEDIIGPMINTIPCRIRLTHNMQHLGLLRTVYRNNLSCSLWQHASLRSIQKSRGQGTLWDAIFVFQGQEESSRKGDAVKTEIWEYDKSLVEVAKVQYPLNVEVHREKEAYIVHAACTADFMDRSELWGFVKRFSSIFVDLVENPNAYVSAVSDAAQTIRTKRVSNGSHVNGVLPAKAPDSADSALLGLLHDVTKVPKSDILPQTSLLSLGVDSVTAIQLASKARKLGIDLHSSDFLRAFSISDLLERIKASPSKAQSHNDNAMTVQSLKYEGISEEEQFSIFKRLKVGPDHVDGLFPASEGMKWLIAMYQLSNHTRFQHAFPFSIDASIDEGRLKRAWLQLLQHHEILRSSFAGGQGNARIVTFKTVHPERHWRKVEVTDSDNAIPRESLMNLIVGDIVDHPRPTTRPPTHATFVRICGQCFLIIHLHHFQYDAWSLRLLIEDLQILYFADDAKVNVSDHDLGKFLNACNQISVEDQSTYWQRYLGLQFQPVLFPKKHHESTGKWNVFKSENVLYDLTSLKSETSALGLRLTSVFLGSWARVQSEYAQSASVTFGLWHLGRGGEDGLDKDRLALPCINVLPLHIHDASLPIADVARKIQETLSERSSSVEKSGLENIAKWTGVSGQKLLNVFVNVVNVPTMDSEDLVGKVFLRPMKLPYRIGHVTKEEAEPSSDTLALCNLLDDAILIDIILEDDRVSLVIEGKASYIDAANADSLFASWSSHVRSLLPIH